MNILFISIPIILLCLAAWAYSLHRQKNQKIALVAEAKARADKRFNDKIWGDTEPNDKWKAGFDIRDYECVHSDVYDGRPALSPSEAVIVDTILSGVDTSYRPNSSFGHIHSPDNFVDHLDPWKGTK